MPHSSNQGLCDAVHPVGVALGGTGQWGYKDDYIPHHEPFDYYATTANPHHLTIATDAAGNDVLSGSDSLSTVGKDTQSFGGGYGVDPQFNTPNHQYDTSDFDQLMSAINAGHLPASDMPAVSFIKAPGYQDGHAGYSNPQTSSGSSSTRSTRSSSRRTGRARPSSSTTTTPTAGMTTRSRASSTRRCRRLTI